MNIKEEKEIMDIVKDIKDIDKQLKSLNPEYDKLQEITIKAKKKFYNETSSYEALQATKPNTKFIPINEMAISEFIQRLPFYRSLYVNELIGKVGKEYYEELAKKWSI